MNISKITRYIVIILVLILSVIGWKVVTDRIHKDDIELVGALREENEKRALLGDDSSGESVQDEQMTRWTEIIALKQSLISALENIYAPKDIKDIDKVRVTYDKLFTNTCMNELVSIRGTLTQSDLQNTFELVDMQYGFKEHQEDGLERVYCKFKVSNADKFWTVNIEFQLTEEAKVYNLVVW